MNYTNDGGIPQITSTVDINNPANFHWLVTDRGGTDVGRVNVQDEERETETTGGRFAVTWGDDQLNLKMGGAYDEVSRDIRPFGNDAAWQAAACGGNPASLRAPAQRSASVPRADGGEIAAANTPRSPLAKRSRIRRTLPTAAHSFPNAAVPGYLRPTQYGFVTVDWDAFARDSNYAAVHDAASLEAGVCRRRRNWGSIAEEATGLFAQLNGDAEIGDNRLAIQRRRALGEDRPVRDVASRRCRIPATPALTLTVPAFPTPSTIVENETEYENWLPAANVAWNLTDNAVVRAGPVQDDDPRESDGHAAGPVDPQRRRIAGRSRQSGARTVSSRTTSTSASSTTPVQRVISASPLSARASKGSRSGSRGTSRSATLPSTA